MLIVITYARGIDEGKELIVVQAHARPPDLPMTYWELRKAFVSVLDKWMLVTGAIDPGCVFGVYTLHVDDLDTLPPEDAVELLDFMRKPIIWTPGEPSKKKESRYVRGVKERTERPFFQEGSNPFPFGPPDSRSDGGREDVGQGRRPGEGEVSQPMGLANQD